MRMATTCYTCVSGPPPLSCFEAASLWLSLQYNSLCASYTQHRVLYGSNLKLGAEGERASLQQAVVAGMYTAYGMLQHIPTILKYTIFASSDVIGNYPPVDAIFVLLRTTHTKAQRREDCYFQSG